MTGYIKKVLRDKRFGFVRGEDGTEYFLHESDVGPDWNRITEGTKVTFEPVKAPKGPRASDVRVDE